MATQAIAETLPALSPEAERFSLSQRKARMFAMSLLVPDHLRKGTPDQAMANCYIAMTLAEAMGEVPLVVMQNIHIVNGKAGFASQYMIARANAAGIFKGRIDWRIDKSDRANLKVTAFAVLRDTGGEVAVEVDMAMAQAEGWTKNPKYKSMPEVMLRYRSAAFLVRFYAPDVMLGYQTVEEVEDLVLSGTTAAAPLTAAALIEQAQDDTAPQPSNLDDSPAEPDAGPAHSEPIAEAAPNTLAERMAEVARRSREPEQGPADVDMGEKTTLADAIAEIDACGTVIDVNGRTAALLPLLGEEDADALRNHAMDRIQTLSAKAG